MGDHQGTKNTKEEEERKTNAEEPRRHKDTKEGMREGKTVKLVFRFLLLC
jgi:hypothetical protein